MTQQQQGQRMSREKQSQMLGGIYLLPNLFTIAALFFGFYSIILAWHELYVRAVIMLFMAMVFDGLDGRVARMINAQSEFGAELDSLADMVSFGVAPALILYKWSLMSLGKAGWLIAFIYVACTALRLARFNVRTAHHTSKAYFQGLSTTAAAGCVASLVWFCDYYQLHGVLLAHAVAVLTVLLGLLKVSTIAFRSFKDFNYGGRVPFSGILVVVLLFVLVSFDPVDVLALLLWGYAMSGPISSGYRFFKRRKRRAHLKAVKK